MGCAALQAALHISGHLVKKIDEDTGGEDFRCDDRFLARNEEHIDWDSGASEFLKFCLDGGVWFCFIRLEENDALLFS